MRAMMMGDETGLWHLLQARFIYVRSTMKYSEIRSTKEHPGWLLPYLLGLDEMFIGRWEYWLNAVQADRIPIEPIPYVHFQSGIAYPGNPVMKNLNRCIDYASCSHSNVVEMLVDWLLWGFHYKQVIFPNVDEKTDDFWYRTFNLGLFYKEPGDYMAELAQSHNIGSGSGFFSTPLGVADMMVKMTMGGEPRPYHKSKSVMDPCCGTGSMLLCASNYSLNLYGNDINPLLCKMAIVNAYVYMPWIVYRPKDLTMFNRSNACSIVEVELPSGVKIPECQECGNRSDFVRRIETDCSIQTTSEGIELAQSQVLSDIIGCSIEPDDIECAPCSRKYKEEAS